MGYSNRTWACPFFKWDDKRRVICEGGSVSLPKQEFAEYVDQYCADIQGWKNCPIAKSLAKYYERTDTT